MGERRMLPIHAILNQSPSQSRPGTPSSQPSASELSSPASDATDSFAPVVEEKAVPKPKREPKRARDSSDLSYTRPQGPIKYAPFEVVDEVAHNLMRPFNIYPFGEISHFCAHIPYSSDKKDVFRKTGRENFNVFVYRFTDPNDHQTYDVMWDYLGGFVRISPFFKSRKHKKTGPAKMLDANKGLRDITFHMTGGNRIAQGYWIPYGCARAVCATFCYPIAGALIPIFGPDFPRDCVRPDSPRFGCMDIDENIIHKAKLEVKAYRHASPNNMPKPASVTSNPAPFRDPYSISMKERLEHYSASKVHPSEAYVQGTQNTGRINIATTGFSPGWMRSPSGDLPRAQPSANYRWGPSNPTHRFQGYPQNGDPFLTAIPRTRAEEHFHPTLRSGNQSFPAEPHFKRQQPTFQEPRKRQKLAMELAQPVEQIQSSYFSFKKSGSSTPDRTGTEVTVGRESPPAQQSPPGYESPRRTNKPSGKETSVRKDFEAACILMDMPRFVLPPLDAKKLEQSRSKSI